MPVYADPVDGLAVPADLLQAWTARLVEAAGTPPDIAADVAEVLVASDRRGIASHGTARLPNYLGLIEAGVMDPAGRPVVHGGRPALRRFDGRNGWGHHAGRVAMDAAIDGARSLGISMAVVHGSNHYGIAGWYALRAAHEAMIGISMSNTSPLVAPTRARAPLIGTNPIAVAAPAGRFGAFCLDMATSTIPRGRIEVAARRGEALPVGWAIDAQGRPATTPEAALAGALHPLGGEEATGGHKGYGLALAVDLLTGVLGDAAYGPDILGLFSTDGLSDLGQAFIAIDPSAIDVPGAFEARLERYLEQLVAAPTVPDAPGRVLVPGEPEAEAERRADERGVMIDAVHANSLAELGARLGVPFDPAGGSSPPTRS
ncbi:MAG TPA: Ldh family oxidoreductase [Candidatus Limnocylindrales bacterium]|nr:Ldh family oxidoreductase [Candidatus Limnocylindrales bacterium]